MMDGGVVDGGMMHRGMMDGSVVGLVMRLAGVLDVGNVAGVSVVNVVGHGLETAVGELNMVLALGGVAVAALSGTEVETVLISDTVLIGVMGGSGLVLGLMVASVVRGRGVVDRGVMDWGMVDNGGVVDGGVMHGGVVHGGVVVDRTMVGDGRGGKGSSEDEVLKRDGGTIHVAMIHTF